MWTKILPSVSFLPNASTIEIEPNILIVACEIFGDTFNFSSVTISRVNLRSPDHGVNHSGSTKHRRVQLIYRPRNNTRVVTMQILTRKPFIQRLTARMSIDKKNVMHRGGQSGVPWVQSLPWLFWMGVPFQDEIRPDLLPSFTNVEMWTYRTENLSFLQTMYAGGNNITI